MKPPEAPIRDPNRRQAAPRSCLPADLVGLLAIGAMLLCCFEPGLLLQPTITSGGDTASHYYTAVYLRDHLLPTGRISGWCPGNLAGFPMLQNYFPLPFVLMAGLSWLVSMPVAFKLVTVLGTFLLPPCTYLFFRCLRQPFPVPLVGAAFSVVFLFHEGNSMWGGNIPSTLAGTFCYSLGFSLAVLWLGLIYRLADTGRGGVWRCGALLALVGFCHGYGLLLAGTGGLFILAVRPGFAARLRTLLAVYAVAVALMAFWLMPYLAFSPNTTRFSILWIFHTWRQAYDEILPPELRPLAILSVAAVALCLLRRRGTPSDHWGYGAQPGAFLVWLGVSAAGWYAIGNRIGVVDIRFLPLTQYVLAVSGALLVGRLPLATRPAAALAGALVLASLVWADAHESIVYRWVHSNYSGFAVKRLWPDFRRVQEHLRGTFDDPRVVYEHSQRHRHAGTVRAFESTPLFAGRGVLEGVYIQASPTAPFIFYLQSEISQKPSTPIPDYCYSRFDLARALDHMRLLNVGAFVTSEPETRQAALSLTGLAHGFRSGPYDVFTLAGEPGAYVVPLDHRPVRLPRRDWRRTAYRWFRLGNMAVVPVFIDPAESAGGNVFLDGDPRQADALPQVRLPAAPPVQARVTRESIAVAGATPGHPLLVKMAYHPNWRVAGADRIHLAGPGFMLVVPNGTEVRLRYTAGWPGRAGLAVTLAALLLWSLQSWNGLQRVQRALARGFERRGTVPVTAAMAAVMVLLSYHVVVQAPEFPVLAYNRGLDFFDRGDYAAARGRFAHVVNAHPQTLVVSQAAFHHAMCYFREERWPETIAGLERLLADYPDSRRAAEARYHVGLCRLHMNDPAGAAAAFTETIRRYPGTPWAGFARERLEELSAP